MAMTLQEFTLVLASETLVAVASPHPFQKCIILDGLAFVFTFSIFRQNFHRDFIVKSHFSESVFEQ
jgi:hypothetical protein